MTIRTRHGRISGRRRSQDGGLLILILALVLAVFVGSSFRKAGGRNTSLVLCYLDTSTRELVRSPSVAKLPTRRVEEVASIIDLLRNPPAGEGLATAVPAGFTARNVTLLPGGILHVVLGVARGQPPMGFGEENALYWQLVNSMLSLPGVSSVELSVDGRPTGTFLSFVKTQRELTANDAMLDKGQPVDLYFVAADGRLVVERRALPTGLTRSQLAFQATRALMEGPQHPSLGSPLPGTDVLRGVTVFGRTASVDFEESVLKLNMGAEEEEQAKNSLVLTLTRLAGVSRVRLLVSGHSVQSLFGHVDAADPLFRLDGSLEAGTAVAVYSLTEVDGDKLPVLTVYPQKQGFTGRNIMISKSIAQMANPPSGDTSLVPLGTKVSSMALQGNSGTLLLSLGMTSVPQDQAAEALMVEQLRLSLTELPSVTSLQIGINGSVAFLPGGYYIGNPFLR
ncbi:MAG: GerMN domain-containing protein [Caldiserica bacterium]|nr:GerMN domain-containing protein [Caldisericota bacterium]